MDVLREVGSFKPEPACSVDCDVWFRSIEPNRSKALDKSLTVNCMVTAIKRYSFTLCLSVFLILHCLSLQNNAA